MTNKAVAAFLLALLTPIAVYVLSADWTFAVMRDGIPSGAFPLAYLVLTIFFAGAIAIGPSAADFCEGPATLTLFGAGRVLVFLTASGVLCFYHDTFGFLLVSAFFLAAVGWLAGQRRPAHIALYTAPSAIAVVLLFRLLGFNLNWFPKGWGW